MCNRTMRMSKEGLGLVMKGQERGGKDLGMEVVRKNIKKLIVMVNLYLRINKNKNAEITA